MNKTRSSVVYFIKESLSSHFKTKSFTIESVSNPSEQLLPNTTLISLTNFLPEQLNLERQWEVAISERTYPSRYQHVTEGKFMFIVEKSFQIQPSFAIWYPVSTLPLRILLKPWTLSFKKDAITAKAVSQLKCLEERKKLRVTLQMKDMVLHSLVRTWDIFSVAMLAVNLEWCWEKKDLANKNLLTTLYAYSLSWYTRTWLSTKSLVTRKPHCFVAFRSFEISKLETI